MRVHADYIGAFERLYAPLAGACGLLVMVVWVVYRDDAPVEIAAAGMGFDALLLLALHATSRGGVQRVGPALQLALHAPLGVGTAALAYFMGPHSGMAAFLAALFVLIGMTGTSTRWSRVLSFVASGSVALGQAILVGLVVTEVIPDRSMFPIVPTAIEPWKVAVTHAALQGVYGFAFFAGNVFRRRYAAVALRAAAATRSAIRRDALLAEARAEHQRALVASLVIYRVLVDRPAFVGNNIDVLRLLQEGVPDPRYYAEMSEDVELVLRIATAPAPRDRFDSAAEMAVAFATAFAGELAAPVRERGRGLRERMPWAAR